MLGILLMGGTGKALAASCLDGVSVFGGSQIELRDRVEIASGTAISNGTSGNGIVVGNDAKTRDLKSGSDIILGDRSTALGSATAGGTVTLNSGASVSGAIHEGVNVPLCEIPEEPDFQTGSESHNVWNSNTLELSPGEYDEVKVFSNSTLKLESGTYSFNLLRFEADAILELNADNGTVEILVENSLSFGDRTLFNFSGGIQAPSRVKFYSGQTSTVYVGTDVNFYGTLIAPLAQVKAFSRTVFRGAVHGKSIDFEPDAVVNYVPLVAPGLDLPDIYPPTYIPGHTSYLDACVLAFESPSLPEGSEWVPACLTSIEQDIFKREVAEQIPGRNLSSNPPKIADMTVFPLDPTTSEGNAVLEVMFEETLPDTMKFVWQRAVKTMRDDGVAPDNVAGDGIYTVLLEVDFATLPSPEEGEEGIGVPIFGKDIVSQSFLPTGEVDLTALENPEPLLTTCGSIYDPNPECPMHPEKVLMIRTLEVVNDPERTSDPCLELAGGEDVLGEPTKKWTFGYLMSQMVSSDQIQKIINDNEEIVTKEQARPIAYSNFAREWLNSWKFEWPIEGEELVNGQEISNILTVIHPQNVSNPDNTTAGRILTDWENASRDALGLVEGDENFADPPLVMNLAPFRLLAIVNRFDLRESSNWIGGPMAGGELRFVFTPLRMPPSATGPCGRRVNETLILEYAVDLRDQQAVQKWAEDWAALDDHDLSFPKSFIEYNKELEIITESVVRSSVGDPYNNRPNGSALAQIRTNETPGNVHWDLREFVIANEDPNKGEFLKPNTVFQTPADDLNKSDVLGQWILENKLVYGDKNKPIPDIPATYPSNTDYFLGARTINSPIDFFDEVGIGGGVWQPAPGYLDYSEEDDRTARHRFSINTCTACHSLETRGPRPGGKFRIHVLDRDYEKVSELSNFLTGLPTQVIDQSQVSQTPEYVPDPVTFGIRSVHYITDMWIKTLTWTDSKLVALGDGGWTGMSILATPDGAEYSFNRLEGIGPLHSVDWNGNNLIAVGETGSIFFSQNGEHWHQQNSGITDNDLNAVLWVESLPNLSSRWIAVGDAGVVTVSTDNGGTWNAATTGHTDALHGLAWGGGNVVAVGENGLTLHSIDGLNWMEASSSTGNTLRSVAWTGSQYVAVGDQGTILLSPDGFTWTQIWDLTQDDFLSATWTGSEVVAVGTRGIIYTSANGTDWLARNSGTFEDLKAVTWTGSQVVVGGGGAAGTNGSGLTLFAGVDGLDLWLPVGIGDRFRYFEDLRVRFKRLDDCLSTSLKACSEGSPAALSFSPSGRVH